MATNKTKTLSREIIDRMHISDLSRAQKGHLAWRLDHKTYVGYLTANRIARGEFGDDLLVTVFERAGKTKHSAKIHARKVADFTFGDTY